MAKGKDHILSEIGNFRKYPRREDKYPPQNTARSRSLSSVALAKGEGFAPRSDTSNCGGYRSILWVVPKWPLPPQDGGRVASCNLIRGLTRRGEVVDMIAVAGEDEAVDIDRARKELGLRHVFVVRRKATPTSTVGRALTMLAGVIRNPLLGATLQPYAVSSVKKSLTGLIAQQITLDEQSISPCELTQPWSVIVYDGLHGAAYSSRFGRYNPAAGAASVIYRAQNCEADLWFRRASESRWAPVRWFIRYQGERVRRFENSLIQASHRVATVSEGDLQAFRQSVPEIKGAVVPVGYEFEDPAPLSSQSELKVMFLGRLDWYPNRDGLKWFLERVWPQVLKRRKDISLAIAGSGSANGLGELFDQERVTFLGRVADVKELYEKSALSLVPVFYGSGTRVKAIEASRYGRSCLSTELGVDGIGLTAGESYFRAESEQEWIDCLVELDHDRVAEAGTKAYAAVRENFDILKAADRFRSCLGVTANRGISAV